MNLKLIIHIAVEVIVILIIIYVLYKIYKKLNKMMNIMDHRLVNNKRMVCSPMGDDDVSESFIGVGNKSRRIQQRKIRKETKLQQKRNQQFLQTQQNFLNSNEDSNKNNYKKNKKIMISQANYITS